MKHLKRIVVFLTLSFIFFISTHTDSYAQCAACKEAAESSLKEGNTQAKGLNLGIMYLLVIPYMLVGGIGYYWYANSKKDKSGNSI
ncbi:MAG: hypothetical protein H0W62_13645 [Chitinophagales bacterium]|nr:hypothetical protein [Chitinophagales bacterium]